LTQLRRNQSCCTDSKHACSLHLTDFWAQAARTPALLLLGSGTKLELQICTAGLEILHFH
jgi:hypothetical protein